MHFALIVLISLVIRAAVIAEKQIIKYDDSLTYLMATGHTSIYEEIAADRLSPLSDWVKVSRWRSLVEVEESLAYQQIAHDMAYSDIHPPLYFWALHLWLTLAGVGPWTGPLLNLLIDASLATVLFLFASDHFKDQRKAVLVSAVWLLSPVAIQTSSWVRQYSLFSMLGMVFALLTYSTLVSNEAGRYSLWRILGLIIVTTAGLLTHYYFVFFIAIAAAGIVIDAMGRGKDAKIVIVSTVVLGTAAGLFVLIFPGFVHSFSAYAPPQAPISDSGFRTGRTVYIGVLLFSPLLLTTVFLLIDHFLSRERRRRPGGGRNALMLWIAGFALGLWFLIATLFLAKVSPQHAMGAKYVSFVAPFVAFLAVLLLDRFEASSQRFVSRALLPGMFLLSLLTLVPTVDNFVRNRLDTDYLQRADVIVLDNANSGVWPSIVLMLNEESEIFLAAQPYLIHNADDWLPQFCAGNAVYVSFIREAGTSIEGREEITKMIRESCDISLVSVSRRPLGDIQLMAHQ